MEKKTTKKKLVVPLAALALILSAGGGVVAAAHADSTATSSAPSAQTAQADGQGMREKPAAVGKVTAVSGTSITLVDQKTSTTYTVDAGSATITKSTAPVSGSAPTAPATISASDIAVGDTLMVQGSVSGTTITATKIHDGEMGRGGMGGGRGHGVHGTVTAVSGTTLTVKAENGTSYTVDASAADATKMQTISISDVSIGDTVGIEGTTTGTTITAKHVMDGAPTK